VQAVRRPYEELQAPKVLLLQTEGFADASLDAVAVDGGGGMLA